MKGANFRLLSFASVANSPVHLPQTKVKHQDSLVSPYKQQVCDSYCICTMLPSGPSLDPKIVSTPRKRSGSFQFIKTETIKKSDVPRWKTGVGQFPFNQDSNLAPSACFELCVMAQRMLGSELLGRTNVELAALLSESHTDRYDAHTRVEQTRRLIGASSVFFAVQVNISFPNLTFHTQAKLACVRAHLSIISRSTPLFCILLFIL
jgi:hypothetical protein